MRHLLICFAVLAIVFTFSSYASADPNLIVNGGFETGNFAGWSHFGNTTFTTVDCKGTGSFFLGQAHSGNCEASFGPFGSDGGIFQTTPLATVAGQTYSISFWLANDNGAPNDFSVYWDGNLLTKFAASSQFDWKQYQFTVTAVGDDNLTLRFRQDPGFIGLDDVSVTPGQGTPRSTPEPATLTLLGLGLAGLGISRKRLVR